MDTPRLEMKESTNNWTEQGWNKAEKQLRRPNDGETEWMK